MSSRTKETETVQEVRDALRDLNAWSVSNKGTYVAVLNGDGYTWIIPSTDFTIENELLETWGIPSDKGLISDTILNPLQALNRLALCMDSDAERGRYIEIIRKALPQKVK